MKAKDINNIIAEQSSVIDIDSVKLHPKNPRRGDVAAIAEILAEVGQHSPIIVQKSTGYILVGNHRWKAAKTLGWTEINASYVDVDDVAGDKIVVSDNRASDLGSYSTEALQNILAGLPNPIGTGYKQEEVDSLLEGIAQQSAEAVESILRPPVLLPDLNGNVEWGESDNSVGGGSAPGWSGETADVELPAPPRVEDDPEDIDNMDDALGQLQGLLQLTEDVMYDGNNYYGIPDLARAGLLDKLPPKVDTWAGPDATTDDGETLWVWNYGVASRKGLPMDRAILSFYTYDHHFDGFWENPAFMTAKMINLGIKYAIVPDFSFYSDMPVATWIYNTYRAQWLGRYFQDAGIKVIPRIQFGIDKLDSVSLDFNCMGIPVGAPVVAKCSHNANSKEEFDWDVYGLRKSLEKIKPHTLLMYGGNPAKRVLEALKPVENGLCQEVVHVYNYAHKRRGVVFDKKEGLAAMNKDKQRQVRDAAASTLGSKLARPTKPTDLNRDFEDVVEEN